MSTATETTVTLYAATDSTGRLYLVDKKDTLPADIGAITEFRIALEKVEGAILQVQIEEIRRTPVTIRVGDYAYVTPPRPERSAMKGDG